MYSKSHVNKLQANGELPVEGIATMAYYYFQQEDNAQVIKMLEPLFAGEAKNIGRHHEGVLDLLCDAYNRHYTTDRKKRELLQHMCQHHNKTIRSAAWQRTASWQHDLGNVQAAQDELAEAMRADPDNPSHALLELVLLVASQQLDQARQRAAFWYVRLKRHQHEFPELLATNDRDPLTRDLFDDDDTDDELTFEDPMANAAILLPPDNLAELEAKWDEVRPLDKPFSTDFDPRNPEDIWSDSLDDEWPCFLEQHPQAINSLDVLDDVVTLIYTHPLNETPYGPIRDCYPVLQRAGKIVEQAGLPADITLPWIIPGNRPLLWLLAHQVMICEYMHDDKTEATRLSQRYLRLNPTDNHGYRAELVNTFLRADSNQQAAAICARYPHDMLAKTCYGHVLALHRLGDLAGATRQLSVAAEHLPLVREYLLHKRVAKPKFSAHGVTIGGKDQAWIYREDMRDCWAETAG